MPLVDAQFSSVIPRNARGRILIDYLCERFDYQDRTAWLDKIDSGLVLLDGQQPDPMSSLMGNESMIYLIRDYAEPEIPLSWELIAENDTFLVIGKSAGQPINRTGRIIHNTLVQILRRHYGSSELSPLYRLDRETSGLMVFGRTAEVCKVAGGGKHQILGRKFYLAICHGTLTKPLSCTHPLTPAETGLVRSKMIHDPRGKACRTDFWPLLSNSEFSLVLAEIHSGRKHQIRAHLEQLGHPIVGDKIYGSDGSTYARMASGNWEASDDEAQESEFQLLHAWAAQADLGQGMTWFQSKHWSPDFQDYLELWPEHRQILRLCWDQLQCGEYRWFP